MEMVYDFEIQGHKWVLVRKVERKMIYRIIPVSKPRQTRSDKWKQRPCVMRYRAFADACREAGMKIPEYGASITFYIPMPKSWSKKKKIDMNGAPHQSRPDLDNLLKSILDAVYADDSVVWQIKELKKIWCQQGGIQII